MPDRNTPQGFSGPDRTRESRAFDDGRFPTRELRFRPTHRSDYGHDENYRPGYHEGGTRFGFFGAAAGETPRPQTDQEFDPDYLSWRDRQMARHDRDYAEWRRDQHRRYDDDYWKFRAERRDDFHQRFQDWRAQREAAAHPDDKL